MVGELGKQARIELARHRVLTGFTRIEAPTPNIYGEFDANSPINNAYIGAACGNSLPGWPCDKTLDELRSAWLRETEPAKRQQALDAVQRRAYEVLPYIAYGQYSAVLAARKEVCNTQALWRGIPSVWVLDK